MRKRMVDYLMETLYDEGVQTMFFVPGSGDMFLTDAIARHKEMGKVAMHHEQAAAMAAITYAKQNENLGAVTVTTGCGGTNAITALLHAYQDNVPCVFVSGQAERNHCLRNAEVKLRQLGRQEADIIEIVSSVSKYAVMINDPEDAVYETEKAIAIARAGRKGPVWIDVPLDVQNSVIEIEDTKHYKDDSALPPAEAPDIDFFMKKLAAAKRPVLLAGGGVRLSGALQEFKAFVEKFKIPLVFSRLGHDLIPSGNPLSIGMVGMLGSNRASNFAVQNSDLVIAIGSRLSINTTGYAYEEFARAAEIIVVDIDEEEHKKDTVRIDKFIHADARDFLAKVSRENAPANYDDWAEKCLSWKNKFSKIIGENIPGGKINIYYFVKLLSESIDEESTVISDAGDTYYATTSGIHINDKIRSITSAAQAEMGYSLPAAIGASFAGARNVFALTGDGSLMMNLQELETLKFNERNVKLIVFNNNGYSCIRKLQDGAFRGRVIGCDPMSGLGMPNFKKIANAFEIDYISIRGDDNIREKISELRKAKGPIFCEVFCTENQEFLNVASTLNDKKRMVTRPLEDQAPFIDREEIRSEMIIEPLPASE